ncbi:hypothetical protein [Tellurirhabdus rosea]|uniref:hypothetical protein n=1 Tax=Tellurirhabdus rosea TaxID=2674997 RepID=UPI002253F22C|nr:hypothetical protein [Tellurirhabdus rosea]
MNLALYWLFYKHMKQLVFILSFLPFFAAQAQSKYENNPDYVLWSATRKLQASDYRMARPHPQGNTPVVGMILVGYDLRGYDLYSKHLNKKVVNYLQRSGSWMDTTNYEPDLLLTYEQTRFDILEVYARKLRKELKDNRRTIILRGGQTFDARHEQLMAECNRLIVEYSDDTDSGRLEAKQRQWEARIQTMLAELAEYAYDR